MIEIVILAIIGTALAGIWDLRTTEVPDQLPYGMIAVGIGYWVLNWVINGDIYSLAVSLLVGSLLLVFGLILYKRGQWGGADAWILAAIGYMIPVYSGSIFIIPYLMNFMIVAIAYTVVYALIIGLLHADVFRHLAKDLREKAKIIGAAIGGLVLAILLLSTQLPSALQLWRLVPLIFLLLVFWRYAVVLEGKVFKKKIPASKLRIGDVLEKGNWVGLTERQIKKIRRTKRFVTIKDGMRFVPVFAIALVLTLLYGNLFFMIFG